MGIVSKVLRTIIQEALSREVAVTRKLGKEQGVKIPPELIK